MIEEIAIAAIGAVATIIVAYVTILPKLKNEKISSIEKTNVIELLVFLTKVGPILNEIERIAAETEVDRVLMFVATNGRADPRKTNKVWEYREQSSEFNYIDQPLDINYQYILRNIKQNGHYSFVTASEEEGMLKTFYEAEGVRHSIISLISLSIKEAGDVAIWYISYAAHDYEISDATRLRFDSAINRLNEASI